MDSSQPKYTPARHSFSCQILQACSNTNSSVTGKHTACSNTATIACTGCLLVQYCSKECQQIHWPAHKVDCQSPFNKSSWKPTWETEGRVPSFVNPESGGPNHTSFGGKKYLWGNVPAIDVLSLQKNEGLDYSRDLRILFGASGDCRHLIKTVEGLPSTYTGSLEIVLNDRDIDLVARNALLLLVAFVFDPEVASPIMLHLWYSAFVPSAMLTALKEEILPLVQYVCTKIESKSATVLQSKTWSFGDRSLRLTLSKESWKQLLLYFEVPKGLTTTSAKNLRVATTLSPHRKDYVDRALYDLLPGQRVAMRRFRLDGILLPFESPRDEFDTPNPTFFQNKNFWPMNDSSDPRDGWDWQGILTSTALTKNDMIKVAVHLFQLDILQLPKLLTTQPKPQGGFDRIEVSNVVDGGYIGTKTVLATFGPMLRTREENPHATLIGLYLNAVHEVSSEAEQKASLPAQMKRLARYIPVSPQTIFSGNMYNADVVKLINAKGYFSDFDAMFERYMHMLHFETLAKSAGLVVKDKNSIVEKWPMRLRENASQEEFNRLLQSTHHGSERYVEWERVE